MMCVWPKCFVLLKCFPDNERCGNAGTLLVRVYQVVVFLLYWRASVYLLNIYEATDTHLLDHSSNGSGLMFDLKKYVSNVYSISNITQ